VKLLRKIKTLSQDYKRHKRLLHGLPITAVILIIIAIVFIVKIPQVWWVGLMQIGLAIFCIVMYIIGLAYYNYKIEKLEKQENEFLENAYRGFTEARQSEMFPICGMNTITIDYLLSVLAIRFKEYDVATKLLSTVITSSGANARIKDKAREMKEQILREQSKK